MSEDRLKEALEALVEQIELTRPTDAKGHDLRMNSAFLDAKALLEQMDQRKVN